MWKELNYWLSPTKLGVELEGFIVMKGEQCLKALVYEEVNHLEVGLDYSVRVFRQTVGGDPHVFHTQAFLNGTQAEAFLAQVYAQRPDFKALTENVPARFK